MLETTTERAIINFAKSLHETMINVAGSIIWMKYAN